MAKRKRRTVIAEAPGAGESDVPSGPDPGTSGPGTASGPAETAEPLGKLWTWTPDAEPAEVPLAARVADVIREVEVAAPVSPTDGSPVGVLWTWTPPAEAAAAPAPPAPPAEPVSGAPADAPPLPLMPVAPVFQPTEVGDPPVGRAASDQSTPTPAPTAAVKTKRRRQRKSRPAPVAASGALVEAPPAPEAELPVEVVPESELTTLRPVFRLDPDLVMAAPALLTAPVLEEQLDEPWTVVAPPRSRVPRGVRIAALVAVLATCAALPWAVPQIPDLFAEAVPEQTSTPTVTDPPIEPPKPVPSGGVKINKSLAGKKLAAAGTPLEVIVDRLHVRSDVVPISGATGELVPPDDAQILGWWREGTGVGSAMGSAVITGHTVNGGGGAFDHLGELVPGDELSVRTSKGTIDYIVREAQDLKVEELAKRAKSIFQQTGDGRLVLITCSDFDGKVYRSNAVVYASPVEDRPRSRN